MPEFGQLPLIFFSVMDLIKFFFPIIIFLPLLFNIFKFWMQKKLVIFLVFYILALIVFGIASIRYIYEELVAKITSLVSGKKEDNEEKEINEGKNRISSKIASTAKKITYLAIQRVEETTINEGKLEEKKNIREFQIDDDLTKSFQDSTKDEELKIVETTKQKRKAKDRKKDTIHN